MIDLALQWFQQHLAAIVGVILLAELVRRGLLARSAVRTGARIEAAFHEVWPQLSSERKGMVLLIDAPKMLADHRARAPDVPEPQSVRLLEEHLDNSFGRLTHIYREAGDYESLRILAESIHRNSLAMHFSGEKFRTPASPGLPREDRESLAAL